MLFATFLSNPVWLSVGGSAVRVQRHTGKMTAVFGQASALCCRFHFCVPHFSVSPGFSKQLRPHCHSDSCTLSNTGSQRLPCHATDGNAYWLCFLYREAQFIEISSNMCVFCFTLFCVEQKEFKKKKKESQREAVNSRHCLREENS